MYLDVITEFNTYYPAFISAFLIIAFALSTHLGLLALDSGQSPSSQNGYIPADTRLDHSI